MAAEKDNRRNRRDKPLPPHTIFRYVDAAHRDMIRKCAQYAGISMNAWIIQTTLRAARKELAELKKLEV